MTADSFLVVVLTALVCAAVVGLGASVLLRLLRRRSLVLQICVVALAAVLSVVGGMVAVTASMLVDDAGLTAFLSVAAVSALVSLVMAAMLGMTLVRGSRELGRYAASMGEEAAVEPGRPTSTEFAQLARELSAANRRLADARDKMEAQERSRRELIAWMSHDLRTPLAGIRAMAESLEDGMVDDEHRYFRQIRVQANRLNGMVDDLFELSRINSGSLELAVERVSLYDVVSDTVAELGPVAQARQVDLRGETAHDDLVVQGDPRELSRVVGNLVMNAIQQSLPGGRIVISAHRDSGNLAVLSVEDTAGGIPEADLPRVFDAGWRSTGSRTPRAYGKSAAERTALGPDFPAAPVEATPPDPAVHAEGTHDGGYASGGGGAGLGLAIVRGIVRAHDGDVTVQNIDGGCRFDVILPYSKPVAP